MYYVLPLAGKSASRPEGGAIAYATCSTVDLGKVTAKSNTLNARFERFLLLQAKPA